MVGNWWKGLAGGPCAVGSFFFENAVFNVTVPFRITQAKPLVERRIEAPSTPAAARPPRPGIRSALGASSFKTTIGREEMAQLADCASQDPSPRAKANTRSYL